MYCWKGFNIAHFAEMQNHKIKNNQNPGMIKSNPGTKLKPNHWIFLRIFFLTAFFISIYIFSWPQTVDALTPFKKEKTDGLSPEILMKMAKDSIAANPLLGEKYAQQAFAIAKEKNDKKSMAKSLLLTGRAKLAAKNPQEALLQFESAIEILGNLTPEQALKAECYRYLGIADEQLKLPNQALIHYQKAANLYREMGEKKQEALIYSTVGYIYRNLCENQKSFEYCNKALNIFDSLNDKNGAQSLSFVFALIYNDWGQPEKALEFYMDALQSLENQRDSSGMGYVLSNIAGIYENYIDKAKCYEYNYKALHIFGKIGHRAGLAYIYNGLGMTHLEDKHYDSAVFYFEKSLAYSKSEKIDEQCSFILNNLGWVYHKKGDLKKAKEYYDQSLIISEAIQNDNCLVTCKLSLGNYFLDQDETKTAISYFKSALETANSLKNINFQSQAYFGLSNAFQKTGNDKQALYYFRLHAQMKDSLFRESSQKAIAEMNARYETELKEERILRLKSKNELKSLQLSKSRTMNLVFIITIFAITVFTMIMIMLYFQKQKAYEALVRKNLESVEAEKSVIAFDQNQPIDERELQKPKQALPDELAHRLLQDLRKLIDIEKNWLKPDLNMNDVARQLNTNTAYLSKVINEHLDTNFTAYINEFRVKEARRMLADKNCAHLSIEGISKMVGFNSKSAFNVAFRKFTGLTPSMFQQQINRLKDKTFQMN